MADAHAVPILPPGCEPRFVGEGAANVVFEIVLPQGVARRENDMVFRGKLLRLPKAGTRSYSYRELQTYWETVIRPIFPSDADLARQSLVRLGDSGVVARANAALAQREDARRADFRGSTIAESAEFGMLLEDMRKRHHDDFVLEFKPKWLAQSPSAPASARRCRTCAREAYRNNGNGNGNDNGNGNGNGTGKLVLCPLDLMACREDNDTEAVQRVLNILAPCSGPSSPAVPAQRARLADWLRNNTLLPRLHNAQCRNDPVGPLEALAHDRDADDDDNNGLGQEWERQRASFELAMTLRDCSCFVRVPAQAGRPVEARLADLDRKNAVAKAAYWRAMERRLADEGYYHGAERPAQATACRLERLLEGGVARAPP